MMKPMTQPGSASYLTPGSPSSVGHHRAVTTERPPPVGEHPDALLRKRLELSETQAARLYDKRTTSSVAPAENPGTLDPV
jgi:crotonobetainyl-CoA:carnitine CoA-transferase CaiB-like acyl-CoA transferase